MLEYTELGNTAIKIEPEYLPEDEYQYTSQKQQPPVQEKKTVQEYDIPFGVKIKVISRILLVTALALLLLARFAAVSIANVELEAVKNDIAEQKSKNSDLESILASSMELDTIQDKAMGLGMSFPSGDQMTYVTIVPYSELMEKNTVQQDNRNKSIISQIID